MLILNSRKMIFVHIQKAGGSSVESSFAPALKWNDILLGSTPSGEALQDIFISLHGLDKHSKASQIVRVIGEDLWNDYFSWATIRNPYDRVASIYCYIAATVETSFTLEKIPEVIVSNGLGDWLESPNYPKRPPWSYPASKAYIASRASRKPFSEFLRSPYLRVDPSFATQFSFVCNETKEKLLVKRLVKLEELAEQWPSLVSQFNLAGTWLVSTNVTPRNWRTPTKELFASRADVDFVNDLFSDDFLCLGYEMR